MRRALHNESRSWLLRGRSARARRVRLLCWLAVAGLGTWWIVREERAGRIDRLVRVGMTKDEVLAALGPPQSRGSSPRENLEWFDYEGPADLELIGGKDFSVTFENGVVIDAGWDEW